MGEVRHPRSLHLRALSVAALALAFAVARGAAARDLARSDPDRAAILDAARGTEKVKFVVEDLVKDGDFAFLCALEQMPSGGLVGTDEAIDVYQWLFVKDGGKWVALDLPGGFANDAQHVSCAIGPRVVKGDALAIAGHGDIARAFLNELAWKVRDDLDGGEVDPKWLALLGVLERKAVASDVRVEHDKSKLDPVQLKVSLDRCGSAACKRENEEAFQSLNARKDDPKISSLVWTSCQFGLRALSLGPIRRCVDAMAPRPACRPGMNLRADRKDIDRCLAEIHQLCARDFPGGHICQ